MNNLLIKVKSFKSYKYLKNLGIKNTLYFYNSLLLKEINEDIAVSTYKPNLKSIFFLSKHQMGNSSNSFAVI
jgi:hypothetical protein